MLKMGGPNSEMGRWIYRWIYVEIAMLYLMLQYRQYLVGSEQSAVAFVPP